METRAYTHYAHSERSMSLAELLMTIIPDRRKAKAHKNGHDLERMEREACLMRSRASAYSSVYTLNR